MLGQGSHGTCGSCKHVFTPMLNHSSPEAGLHFLPHSCSLLYKPGTQPCALLVLSSSPGYVLPSLFTSSLPLPLLSWLGSVWTPDASATFSLLSTIKLFSSTIPRSGHVLLFIQGQTAFNNLRC